MARNVRSDGFALPVALFALVVVGVLVTGGFFVARQETRIGVASQQGGHAFYLAERGITDLVENYTGADFEKMPLWSDTTIADSLAQGVVRVRVVRMTENAFFLDSNASVTRGGPMLGGANRRLGMIVKTLPLNLDPAGALTTVGNLTFGGSAIIDGNDTDPTGWFGECDSLYTDKPAIVINDTTNIDWNGKESSIRDTQLFGNQDLMQDTTLTPDSLLVFGDLTFDDLTAWATKSFTSPPGNDIAPDFAAGLCFESTITNWGEPLDATNPCFDYFPIVHFDNEGLTWEMTKGRGQGILLVSGNLSVTGQFEFYGPVIIKGTLFTEGGGGVKHFHGGVVAANVALSDNSILGTADIVYSSCAIKRAVLNNDALTQLRPLMARSWVDLSNVVN